MSTHFQRYAANLHRVTMVELIEHHMMIEYERLRRGAEDTNVLIEAGNLRPTLATPGLLAVPDFDT